ADRGLNSGANLLAIKKLDMQYVIAYRLRSAGDDVRQLIADKTGWQSYNANGVGNVDVSRYKIATETRMVRTVDDDGTVKRETITSNLLINYSARRARKDAYDRQRLVGKAERYAENPSLLKSDMRRGGKSYLKIDANKLTAEVDTQRIENAEFFDGYYGIVYSDESLTPREVLSIHHSLWQIEESFRISKSLLKARPCFHWTETRIRGHFLICFLALVLHRLLELELVNKGVQLTAEEIIDALSTAELSEAISAGTASIYVKTKANEHFEMISDALGLGKLARLSSAADVKRALHLKEI
ncbi:MAG: transposase, partial [Sutterellaceae bacterium]|nr:transposase [Sutterellaceae bacterium]